MKESLVTRTLSKGYENIDIGVKTGGILAAASVSIVEILKQIPSDLKAEFEQFLENHIGGDAASWIDALAGSVSEISGEVVQALASHPTEVLTAASVVAASYMIGSKKGERRLAARAIFILTQLGFMRLAIESEAYPIAMQAAAFIGFHIKGIKNQLSQMADEGNKTLATAKEKYKETKEKIKAFKEQAIEKAKERLQKLYSNYISPVLEKIKPYKTATLTALSGVVAGAAAVHMGELSQGVQEAFTALQSMDWSAFAEPVKESVTGVWDYLKERDSLELIGTAAVGAGLYASSNKGVTNRLQGNADIFGGNVLFLISYLQQGMLSQAIQAAFAIGGRAHAVKNAVDEIHAKGEEVNVGKLLGVEWIKEKFHQSKEYLNEKLFSKHQEETKVGKIKDHLLTFSQESDKSQEIKDIEEKTAEEKEQKNHETKTPKKSKNREVIIKKE